MRRDAYRGSVTDKAIISTHAPRVRRDIGYNSIISRVIISTHAPRVRRDQGSESVTDAFIDFYSRASCEARPQHYVIILQSQPISCTRRTFLSFFLHHFDEYTEDKLLFKANLPAFFESFHLRLTMFSQYYDSFRIISFFCSNVFYSSLPVIP